MQISFRLAKAADISKCYEIESESYPEDEAASLQSLIYRQTHASPYFLICENDSSNIVGFICATQCQEFNHDSMSRHDPIGRLLAIHSVVVQKELRRQGIATKMLQEYLDQVKDTNNKNGECVESIVLLAKHHLLGFYIHCGFSVLKESNIVHGQDTWYDLQMSIVKDVTLDITATNALGRTYFIVDSFAFTHGTKDTSSYGGNGNPAAVVLMRPDESVSSTPRSWLQKVAAEFNLSETAFLWQNNNADSEAGWDIRYYTPDGTEIDLCGHATLASAQVLLHHHANDETLLNSAVVFQNIQGILLPASSSSSTSNNPFIHMNFPWKNTQTYASSSDKYKISFDMLQKSVFIQSPNDIIYLGAGEDDEDLFVELTYDAFQSLPSTDKINEAPMITYPGPRRGIIVCCVAPPNTYIGNSTIQFYSRFFGPKAGIKEDPVTGSAHCLLGPYFGKKLETQSVVGMQKSQRGGIVQCLLKEQPNDSNRSIVEIVGQALLVMSGTLCV